jgi:hypothetical protein
MLNFWILAVAVFALGVWIGVGAPGWPHKPEDGRRHREHRPLNPIAWGRTSSRERRRPRSRDERPQIRLK